MKTRENLVHRHRASRSGKFTYRLGHAGFDDTVQQFGLDADLSVSTVRILRNEINDADELFLSKPQIISQNNCGSRFLFSFAKPTMKISCSLFLVLYSTNLAAGFSPAGSRGLTTSRLGMVSAIPDTQQVKSDSPDENKVR